MKLKRLSSDSLGNSVSDNWNSFTKYWDNWQ